MPCHRGFQGPVSVSLNAIIYLLLHSAVVTWIATSFTASLMLSDSAIFSLYMSASSAVPLSAYFETFTPETM